MTQLLLREWGRHYAAAQVWRLESSSALAALDAVDDDAAGSGDGQEGGGAVPQTYFSVVCEYMHYFLLHNMKRCLVPAAAAISAIGNTIAASSSLIATPQPIASNDSKEKIVALQSLGEALDVADESENTQAQEHTSAVQVQEGGSDEGKAIAADALGSTPAPADVPPSPPHSSEAKEEDSLQMAVATALPAAESGGGLGAAVDFFTVQGYPECASASASAATSAATIASGGFSFLCSLTVLRDELLTPLEDALAVLGAVEKSELDIKCLGAQQDLSWLGRLAFNIAALMLKNPSFGDFPTSFNSGGAAMNNTAGEEVQRLLTAARLYEIAQHLNERAAIATAEENDANIDGAACLLTACAARIDAESASGSGNTSGVDGGDGNRASPFNFRSTDTSASASFATPNNNMVQARVNVQRAERLLRAQADFEDARSRQWKAYALMLEFHLLCKLGDAFKLSAFVTERQCADIAGLSGSHGSRPCARSHVRNVQKNTG